MSVNTLVCLLLTMVGSLTLSPAVSLAATSLSVSPDYVAVNATTVNVDVTFSPHAALGDGDTFTITMNDFAIMGFTAVDHTTNGEFEYDGVQAADPPCGDDGNPTLQYEVSDLGDSNLTITVCDADPPEPQGPATIETTDTITLTLTVSAPETGGDRAVTLTSDTFADNPGATTISVGAPTGNRYVAATGGTDAGSCTNTGSPCATLAHALNEANHGETIYVDAGTYNNEVEITKAVNIQNWSTDGKTGNNMNVFISGITSVVIPAATGVGTVTYSGVQFDDALLDITFANDIDFTISGNVLDALSLKVSDEDLGDSSVTVTGNTVVGAAATDYGLLEVEANTVNATNNIINAGTNNSTGSTPAFPGTIIVAKGTHTYVNNTVGSNSSSPVIYITSDNSHIIKNNNLRGPDTSSLARIIECDSIDGENVTIDYNNFYGIINTGFAQDGGGGDGSSYVVNSNTITDCARGGNGNLGDPEYTETTSTTIESADADTLTVTADSYDADTLAGEFAYFRYNNLEKYYYILSNTANTIKLQTEINLGSVTFQGSNAVGTTKYEPSEGSKLVDTADDDAAPSTDFEGTTRDGNGIGADIGAYESPFEGVFAPTVSNVLVDNVAVAEQTNAGLYPTISWDYADLNDDPQNTYRVTIEEVDGDDGGGGLPGRGPGGLPGGGPGGAVYIFDSGTTTSTDTSVEVTDVLTAATEYTLKVIVNDGTTSTTSTTTFTTGTPGITASTDAIAAAEGGEDGTFTLVLDTRPADTVTVTFTTENEQVTIDPSPVTFTRANWDTPQTVTVTATDDATVEGEHTDTITMAVDESAAADYSELEAPTPVTVTITDAVVAEEPEEEAAPTSGGGGGSFVNTISQTNTSDDEDNGDNGDNNGTNELAAGDDNNTEEDPDEGNDSGGNDQSIADGSSGATGDFDGGTIVSPSIADIEAANGQTESGTGDFGIDENDNPSPTTDDGGPARFQSLYAELDDENEEDEQADNGFELISETFARYVEEGPSETPGTFSDFQDDDADGIQNSIEKLLGTDPADPDTDGDGINDGQEISYYGTSPTTFDEGIDQKINVNLPKSLTPRTQLPVAAPEGSRVTVYYINQTGKKVFLTTGYTGENNLALLNLEDLPLDEEVRLVTEIVTPDNETREIISEELLIKLSRLTADTAIVYIDGNRVRDFDRTYVVKNRDAVIEGQIPTRTARWNIASLVFGSMILTDSNSGQVSAKIPQEILDDPAVHQASLLAYDPETEEYSEPVTISFVYKPDRLLPSLTKGELSIFDPAVTFSILLTLGALALAAGGVLKYQQRRELRAQKPQSKELS